MQRNSNKFLLCLCVMLAAQAPWAQELLSSKVTVATLLERENAAARANATTQVMQAGLLALAPVGSASAAGKPPPPRQPEWRLKSIYGSGLLRADINVDGIDYLSVPVGGTVLGCNLKEVVKACVVLQPIVPLAKRGAKPMSCPRLCWTGYEVSQALNRSANQSVAGGGGLVHERPLQPADVPLPH